MSVNLRSFFNHFSTHADASVIPLWKYAEFETKFGDRRELQFIGQSAIVIETPDNKLEFMTIQTQEHRVYKHAGYLMSLLAPFYLDHNTHIDIKLYGHAFQAFTSVNNVKVEPINAEGVIERRDRFGNLSEKEVIHISSVRLSRMLTE